MSVRPIVDILIDEHADSARHAEECFIAQSFLSPTEGFNAGVRARLSGKHFLDPANSAIWKYCCFAAERNFDPTIKQCISLLLETGIALTTVADPEAHEAILYELVMSTPSRQDSFDLYAAQIVHLWRKREQASRLIRRVGEVFQNASDVINLVLAKTKGSTDCA